MFALLKASPSTIPSGAAIIDVILAATQGTLSPGTLNTTYWDQAQSYVNYYNGVSGWNIHDSAAGGFINGAMPVVITSSQTGISTDKYFYMAVPNSVNIPGFNSYETWEVTMNNATNPTAINMSAGQWNLMPQMTNGVGGYPYLLVSMTQECLFIAVLSSTYLRAYSILLAEFDPIDPHIQAFNYPSYALIGDMGATAGTNSGGVSRVWDATAQVDTISYNFNTKGNRIVGNAIYPYSQSYVGLFNLDNGIPSSGTNARHANDLKQPIIRAYKLALSSCTISVTSGFSGGPLRTNDLRVTQSIWNPGDEVDLGGVRYFITTAGSNSTSARLLVRKS